MIDISAAQMLKFSGGMPRLAVLTVNRISIVEHYGNLISYMRLKNIFPPTSEAEFLQQPAK